MLKSILILVAYLLSCSASRPDNVDDRVAYELGNTASTKCNNLQIRLAALEAIKELGPRAGKAVSPLTTLLRELHIGEDEADLLAYHAAQALASIGYAARTAIPTLVRAQASVTDPKAKTALKEAVRMLAAASAPAKVQAQPPNFLQQALQELER